MRPRSGGARGGILRVMMAPPLSPTADAGRSRRLPLVLLPGLDGTGLLFSRFAAALPAALVAIFFGAHGTAQLLILSQVILSVQLSFAVFPLVRFTSERAKMGEFVNPRWLKVLAYSVAAVIAGLNAWLLVRTIQGWLG